MDSRVLLEQWTGKPEKARLLPIGVKKRESLHKVDRQKARPLHIMSSRSIKRILVPTDFSEHSLTALDYAIQLARFYKAEILIVHVVVETEQRGAIPEYVNELLAEYRFAAAKHLARLEKMAKRRYSKCRSELRIGIPYQAIAEAAEDYGADLIIMAPHGRTGFEHLLLGSVAERVVRIAKSPVITVRKARSRAVQVRRGGVRQVQKRRTPRRRIKFET